MAVVVHFFVADSSLLDCCDFFFFSFSTVCLQVGSCLGIWGGFSCLFLSFGVSCLLAWLGQPFFVCHQHLLFSLFFLCHRHLWSALSFFATGICVQSLSFMVFSAIGIHVRLFVFALFALASGYQCISQFLVSCCLSASSLEIQTGFFSKLVILWTAQQISLWSKPHLVFRHKVYKIALSEVLATQMGMTEVQHQLKSACLNCTNLTHFCLTAGWFCGNLCIVMFWVACELLQFAATQEAGMVRAFCRPHAYTHSVNNLRWQPHWLPRLTSLLRRSCDWWHTRDSGLGQPTENKINYKPT